MPHNQFVEDQFDHSVFIELSDTSISMMQRSLKPFAQDSDMAWMIMKDNEPAMIMRPVNGAAGGFP